MVLGEAEAQPEAQPQPEPQPGGPGGSNVNVVSTINMPNFLETASDAWFDIFEANCELRFISSEKTMFVHALTSLPPDLIAKIPRSILQEKTYSIFKTAILGIHEKTKPELFARLINQTTMSGRPSNYLRELQPIASKVDASDELVRYQFIQALPARVSPVIAAMKALSLEQLGTLADELTPTQSASAYSVQEERSNFSHRARSKSPMNRPPQSFRQNVQVSDGMIPYGLRPFSKDQRPKICRWHIYFADGARRCKPWCKYPNKRNCEIQPNSRNASPSRNQGNQ